MLTRFSRVHLLVVAVVIAGALIAGLAYSVVHSQERARAGLLHEFGRRAASTATLTTAALTSSAPAQLAQSFSGPPATLARAMRAFQAAQPDARAAILDARGRPLVTWPIGSPASDLADTPAARAALRGTFAISDLAPDSANDITIAVPFATRAHGRRIGIEVMSAQIIESFASAYLAGAPAVAGGRAYLVDGNGRVLGSSTGVAQGRLLPDRKLLRALRDGPSGNAGKRYFVAAPLVGTRWRVVLSAPRARLLASVQGTTRRTAWMSFAAFALAVLGLLAVGLLAVRRSTQVVNLRAREASARRLAHERLHDGLTGLPNRALFLDRVGQALALAERPGQALAVLFVDLDRFKRINDSLGHAAGDELLALVALRLGGIMRAGDTVSRFGGDEFLMLARDLDGVDDALRIAARVSTLFERPFDLGGRDVHVSACVGIAFQPAGSGAPDATALVRDADAAMYRAKAQGPGSARVFDAELHGEALTRLDDEMALRVAIMTGGLRVHYQPIVALPAGETRGVEALVRWERPGVGLVAPDAFIGLAEECGLIGDLGTFVLSTALADVAGWHADGLVGDDFFVSVNISAVQLSRGGLRRTVAEALANWPLNPGQLWLELTETAIAGDPQLAQQEIRALSALGARVAIDDFGVGQSSLEQLVHSLPVDILKVDRIFTGHLTGPRERAVVAAIAPLADALEMTVVAEGVETGDQARELCELGYPLAQGYHFARPIDGDAVRELLAGAPLRS